MNKHSINKIILFSMIILLPSNSFSFNRGSLIVGGNLGYTKQSFESGDYSVILLNPNLVYFLVPKTGIGFDLSYLKISDEDDDFVGYSIGPKLVYYIGDQNSTSLPFFGVSVLFSKEKDVFTETDYQLSGGVTHIIKSSIAITVEAFYLIQENKLVGANESKNGNILGFKFGMGAALFKK